MPKHGPNPLAVWVATGICLLLTGAVVSAALWRPPGAQSTPCPTEPPNQAEAFSAQVGPGLAVVFGSSRMHIQWNPASPAIRSSHGGALLIRDGAANRTIALNAAALAEGGFWYSPSSGDLLVRLTVNSAGTDVSESARVLLSERSAPPVALPAPPVTEKPAPAKPVPLEPLRSFTPPAPIRKVQPPPSAELRRSLTRQLLVRVRLRIDEGGNVAEADTSPLPDRAANALAQSAVWAAKQWAFEPARRNGTPVQCGYSVTFRFNPVQDVK